ncbi:hypothetical protein ENUP19_0272G0009 [Entamoeba nuttalli]|uniref:Uncharacterized protein n=1 Tax=Entamoeba nuttalli TaxID=412467 RepID=A0ABQ0DT23_9EUKA
MNTESNDTSLVENFSIEGSESTSQVSLKDIKNDKDHISSVIGYVKQSNTSIISLFNGYPRWCSLDTSNDTLSDAIANIGESCRRCHHIKNPLGINDIHPPFSRSWKTYVKKGIGLNYQRMFFVKYTGIESFIREHPDYYLSSVLHSFGGCCPPILFYHFLLLTSTIRRKSTFFLLVLFLAFFSIHNPNISFCPILPNILGIVASCCTLDETLCFGQALLTHSSQANNLLPLHPVDYVLISR